MGSQSSKVPRSDLTAQEAADASPSKADRQGNGHSTPKKGTEEAAGATGDAFEPAPPRQGAEAKGRRGTPMETAKKRKDFSFKKVACPQEKLEGGGRAGTGGDGSLQQGRHAQEGKAVATPQSQEHQAKGAEASATSKGGGTEEAGPEVTEPSTPLGPEGDRTPASEQNE
ncbi:hypothetical protein FD755_018728 [Muntiacus reevesi]|uniref:Uncharacterized protein n=1 Tax=Muntiacus reevesi TaxID=9886 RepID=A0A5N3X7N9_MUNRE|nr:hypothetical protein FD755_018728 [Muntiacus reevesi]